MDHIKNEDLNYRPMVCKATVVQDELDNQRTDNIN